jgi:hypothetical protein
MLSDEIIFELSAEKAKIADCLAKREGFEPPETLLDSMAE